MGSTSLSITCENCGSNELVRKGEYFVCNCCNSSFHKSAFQKKSSSKLEEKYTHVMMSADAYERQGFLQKAQEEYEYLISNYPYRPEAYAGLIRILMMNYAMQKKQISESRCKRILVEDVRHSDRDLHVQNKLLKKALQEIETYYIDMTKILTGEQWVEYTSFIQDTETFVENEESTLEQLAERLREREACIKTLLEREGINMEISRMQRDLQRVRSSSKDSLTYRIVNKKVVCTATREGWTYRAQADAGMNAMQWRIDEASKILYRNRIVTWLSGILFTILSSWMSYGLTQKTVSAYSGKAAKADIVVVFCIYLVPFLVPSAILMRKLIKKCRNARKALAYFTEYMENLKKKESWLENEIALRRKKLKDVADSLKTSHFEVY
ncbi:MAG: hypothetical protein J5636_00775 [Clostridiales bacterium]|nr:hypothetical protein [Clostridiales bacterium]